MPTQKRFGKILPPPKYSALAHATLEFKLFTRHTSIIATT